MTEDEAKTKWCPFARVAVAVEDNQRQTFIGVAGANRAALHPKMAVPEVEDRLNPESARCIASACTAWRRQTVMIDRATNKPAIPGQTALGQLEERYSERGFCGLAGAHQ